MAPDSGGAAGLPAAGERGGHGGQVAGDAAPAGRPGPVRAAAAAGAARLAALVAPLEPLGLAQATELRPPSPGHSALVTAPWSQRRQDDGLQVVLAQRD